MMIDADPSKHYFISISVASSSWTFSLQCAETTTDALFVIILFLTNSLLYESWRCMFGSVVSLTKLC